MLKDNEPINLITGTTYPLKNLRKEALSELERLRSNLPVAGAKGLTEQYLTTVSTSDHAPDFTAFEIESNHT